LPKSRIKIQRDLVLPRPERVREAVLFVIAIEGAQTEKRYFQKFRHPKVLIDILPSMEGRSSPEYVIERLIAYKGENDLQDGDECWLVFDVDHRLDEDIEEIYRQALDEQFRTAVSNPCFEFWLFLHRFDADELPDEIHHVPIGGRAATMKKILDYRYSSLRYDEFLSDVRQAIRRAEAGERGRSKHYPRFPGTDVYKLVERLLARQSPSNE
jgi:hypothetical protein